MRNLENGADGDMGRRPWGLSSGGLTASGGNEQGFTRMGLTGILEGSPCGAWCAEPGTCAEIHTCIKYLSYTDLVSHMCRPTHMYKINTLYMYRKSIHVPRFTHVCVVVQAENDTCAEIHTLPRTWQVQVSRYISIFAHSYMEWFMIPEKSIPCTNFFDKRI